MGKRTDEVAKMVVEHYNLPMQPEEWIERSRWGNFPTLLIRVNCYCWGNSSMVEGLFSKWF